MDASFAYLKRCFSIGALQRSGSYHRAMGEFLGLGMWTPDGMNWEKGVMELEGINGVGMGGREERI